MLLFLLSNGLSTSYLNLNKIDISVINVFLASLMYVVILYPFLEQLWITRCRVGMNGDVERNSYQSQSFSICHWNLNILAANSFTKFSLLTAYLSVNKIDIVCLSETLLNSEFLTDDENLQKPGYSIALVDHPSYTKRDWVCVHFKT